jgi:hypothetical protein
MEVQLSLWVLLHTVVSKNISHFNYYESGQSQFGLHKIHKSPINPTPSSVTQGYMEIRTLGHVEGGNRCGGDSLMKVSMTHTG